MKKYIFKKKILLILLIVCISLKVVLNLYMAIIMKKMIDIIATGTQEEFISYSFIALIYFLISIIVTFISNAVSLSYIRAINQNMRNDLFIHIVNLPFIEFKKDRIGDFTSKLNNEVDIIINDYISNYIVIYADILSVIIGTWIIFYINRLFSLLMLAICILLLLIVYSLSRLTVKPRELVIEKIRDYNSSIKEYLSGFMTIKNFGIEKLIAEKFSRTVEIMENSKYKYGWIVSIFDIFSSYLNFAITVIVLILGGVMSFKNMITIGSLIAIIQLLNNIISPVSDLSTRVTKIKSSTKVVQAYISDTSWKLEEKTLQQKDFNSEIYLEDVTYSYDGIHNSIENVNLRFIKGNQYAIIGPSGSGKSTLYKVFCKYLSGYKGSIDIDGVNLNDLDNMSISSIIAVVNQEIFLFNDTLRNNMTLGRDYSDDEIIKILHSVGLDDFISKLGIGLDYLINEEGSNISGGEKCRIAIGRALLQKKKILILDEAFSSLDNIVATKIEKDILNITDLTLINITHRINKNMMEQYDEVIVMNNGNVSELGDYESLYKKGGLLFDLSNK